MRINLKKTKTTIYFKYHEIMHQKIFLYLSRKQIRAHEDFKGALSLLQKKKRTRLNKQNVIY